MNFKRILSAVLAVVMVLGTMGTVVFAESTVAKIGATEYATFNDAWVTAINKIGKTTITLVDDAVYDLSSYGTNMSITDITIDLNGYTLTLSKDLIVGGGFYAGNALTISDSKSTGHVIFTNDAEIALESMDGADTLTVTGGEFINKNESTAMVTSAWSNHKIKFEGGSYLGNVLTVKSNTPTVSIATVVGVIASEGNKWNGTLCAIVDNSEGIKGYTTLAEAVAAVPDNSATTITLADGTHTMPNKVVDKNITIKGSKNAIVEALTGIDTSNSTINFNGVTVKFDNDSYEGFYHSTKITYTDSTHIGTEFLYAPVVSYTACTFKMYNAATEYAVWTYGSNDVTFDNCEFNTNGKAVLVYHEGTIEADITVNECEFTSNGTFTGKAAIELGQSANGNEATYNLTITNSTANENFIANNSTSNLLGNKDGMDANHLSVTVDTVEVPAVAKIGEIEYLSFKDAMNAVIASTETELKLTLLEDITLTDWTSVNFNKSITFTFDGNGKTITGLTAPLFSKIDTYNQEDVTIKNLYIENCNISTASEAATLIGWYEAHVTEPKLDTLIIESVHVIGGKIESTGSYAGGLIGYVSKSADTTGNLGMVIKNCSVKDATITGASSTASIIGHAMNVVIEDTVVGNNTLNTTATEKAKVGVVAGTLNGTIQKIDVTEETQSKSDSELHVIGRAYNKTEITDGSYFTDPTVPALYGEIDGVAGTVEATQYFDFTESNGKYVLTSIGEVGNGHAKNDNGHVTIFGETKNTDPKEELYIELYSNNTLLATSTLNDIDGIYAATTSYLTWHFDVAGDCTDTYWTTKWVGPLSDSYQPNKVVMYVDGMKVSEGTVKMSMPDDLNPVVWGELPGIERRIFMVDVKEATAPTTKDKPYVVNAGDEFEIALSINGTDLRSLEWVLTYDSAAFEYIGTSTEAGKFKGNAQKTGTTNYKADEEIITYKFKALKTTDDVTAEFTLKDAKAMTAQEGSDDTVVEPLIVSAWVKNSLRTDYAVAVKIDGEELAVEVVEENGESIDTFTKEIPFETVDGEVVNHMVSVIPEFDEKELGANGITYTVNGTPVATLAGLNFGDAGEYVIEYVVDGPAGFGDKKGIIYLTITAPEFKVEVNTTASIVADYVKGIGDAPAKKLVLVYTNADKASFEYDGSTMLDATNSGYKYVDHEANNGSGTEPVAYKHVFAYVVDAINGGKIDAYKKNADGTDRIVCKTGENAATPIAVTYGEPHPYDLTNNNVTDIADVTTSYGVYNAFALYFGAEKMHQVLKADINGDKFINYKDTNAVRNAVYPIAD